MLQPVNLQLAHYNVEHSAQISKDALAAAQQTSQTQEVAQESVKRMQIVQNTEAAAETRKVRRRNEDERERRREEQQSFSDLLDLSDGQDEDQDEPGDEAETLQPEAEQKTGQAVVTAPKAGFQNVTTGFKAFDLYA